MSSYTINWPRQIVFGWDTRRQLPALIAEAVGQPNAPYALVVGPSPRNNAVVADAEAILGPAALVYRHVTPDPELADVDGLIDALRAHPEVLVVVGIGGGSVIDVAKAAAAIAPAGGTTTEYFYGKRAITRAGLPFFALPTTAGTGAEITRNSVLTDPATRIKQSIRHPTMVPTAAIIDPALTLSVPANVTAASGLDALTQAVESYISGKANATTRALALKAVQLILPALPRAVADGGDREARAAMAEGSMITGLAFSQSGLGAVHGLAHPLGALFKVTHGQTCAILLPYILRYNAEVAATGLAELATATGFASGDAFIDHIADLCTRLEIPAGFREYGLTAEHFGFIVANCRSNSMTCNPRHMPDADVLALLDVLAAR